MAVDAPPPATVAAVGDWTRSHIAGKDREIAGLRELNQRPEATCVLEEVPTFLNHFDVAYYEGDAAEVVSEDLTKTVGTEATLNVLEVDDPFALILGDSKSDLEVMEWAADNDTGVVAALEHTPHAVLEHVYSTDAFVSSQGDASDILEIYALNQFASLNASE